MASPWPANPDGFQPEERVRARDDLYWAIQALTEVIKFILGDGTEVPAEDFTSQEDRDARAADQASSWPSG